MNLAILRAIENMNAPTASLGKIRSYFRQNKIPVKSRTGKIMNREYVNGLVREFYLEREMRNDNSGNSYAVYKLTPKAEKAIGKLDDNNMKSSKKTPSAKGKVNKKQVKAIEREIASEVEDAQVKKKIVKGKIEKEEKVDFEEYEKELAKCEKCGYMCHPDWNECPNCEDLKDKRLNKGKAQPIKEEFIEEFDELASELFDCPKCGYTCRPDWEECPNCNNAFNAKKEDIKKITVKPKLIKKDQTRVKKWKLPKNYCISCGKKLSNDNELDRCVHCLFEEYMIGEGLFEEDMEKNIFYSFKKRLSNGKISADSFKKSDISFCPACGKKALILKRGRFIKRTVRIRFCVHCYQSFYPPPKDHKQEEINKLYNKVVKLDAIRAFSPLLFLHSVLILSLIFTMLNSNDSYVSLFYNFYFPIFIVFVVSISLIYSKLKKQRLVSDSHYRIKQAIVRYGRFRGQQKATRGAKKYNKDDVLLIINQLNKRTRIKSYIKYIFYSALTMGALLYLSYYFLSLIFLTVAAFFAYLFLPIIDSRTFDKAFRLGAHHGEKDYEKYVLNVLNQFKNRIS